MKREQLTNQGLFAVLPSGAVRGIKKKKSAPDYLPQKIHINKGDKYWITFSQWHKSSGAAGFEAACGVVKHFKRCGVAPFEGMVNRGVRRALAHTGLREVTSPFFLPASSSDPP